jgi:hypothetical protein
MLGDLIYEAEGELINMRVISVEEGRPKIEVTILEWPFKRNRSNKYCNIF